MDRSENAQFGIAIMAAGKGTRLKSRRPKVLHEVGGKPLVEHVIRAATAIVPASDITVIIGHEADQVRAAVQHLGVNFALQTEQRGTGHAIQSARDQLTRFDHILVLSGDAPLIRPQTIAQLRDFHIGEKAAMTILTTIPPDPTGYGRVIRKLSDSAEVAQIIEQKALTPDQLTEKEINSGIYAFAAKPLFANIDRLSTNNTHGEFYLTDMAAILTGENERVVALISPDIDEVLGANTIAEMMSLDAALRMRKARELMLNGVTIFRPETSVIDTEVEVSADTILEPFVQLLGKTKIGTDCRIRSYSVISNSQVGDNVLIRHGCIIDQSRIANSALIGPYTHVRPASDIGEGAHLGNFVETKKTKLGKGSKANHLTYLGDAVIGEGCNIGAGTITCNYDGTNKFQTTIGNRVFIGSDSTLVAPITLGDNAYVAAASCLTEDVPANALALGRARQTNKPNWTKRKKESCE
jgi:bifunctional UDP-N-acetylglucosamine pyrophosphorylase/glucosamine-1-phosphate N-acetyltransferase